MHVHANTPEEVRRDSLIVLDRLEELDRIRESQLPPQPVLCLDDDEDVELLGEQEQVIADLIQAWTLLTDSRQAISRWHRVTNVDTGLLNLMYRLELAQSLVDGVLYELEELPS